MGPVQVENPKISWASFSKTSTGEIMYRAREHQCHLCNGSCRSHLLKRLPIAVPEPPGSAAASVFSWHCFRSELPSSSVTLPVNELSWSALPIRFRITETWNSTGKHTQMRLEVLYCSPRAYPRWIERKNCWTNLPAVPDPVVLRRCVWSVFLHPATVTFSTFSP